MAGFGVHDDIDSFDELLAQGSHLLGHGSRCRSVEERERGSPCAKHLRQGARLARGGPDVRGGVGSLARLAFRRRGILGNVVSRNDRLRLEKI